MNKTIVFSLLSSILFFSTYGYNGSTTAVVTLVGGIIKAQHVDGNLKYKRKDCPVCKGKGWYLSGDGIKKVECGYCEPDSKEETPKVEQPVQPVQQQPKPHTSILRR